MQILNNAQYKSGRIKPEQKRKDPQIDRGIATHNWIGKFFADHFGSGTIKAKVDGKKYYLNKASCFKLLHGSKKNAPQYASDQAIIDAINVIFKATKGSSSTSTVKTPSPSAPKKETLAEIGKDVKNTVDNVNAARNKLLAKFDFSSDDEPEASEIKAQENFDETGSPIKDLFQ